MGTSRGEALETRPATRGKIHQGHQQDTDASPGHVTGSRILISEVSPETTLMDSPCKCHPPSSTGAPELSSLWEQQMSPVHASYIKHKIMIVHISSSKIYSLGALGWGGSVGLAAGLGSGQDPGVLGPKNLSGSLLSGKSASRTSFSLYPSPLLMLSLPLSSSLKSLSSKYIKNNNNPNSALYPGSPERC